MGTHIDAGDWRADVGNFEARIMTAKHTPAPWTISYCGSQPMSIDCVNAKIGGVSKVFDVRGWGYLTGKGHGALGLSTDEAEAIQDANAKLAAAAPTMLDALERVEWWLTTVPQGAAMRDVCRMAIKEARGG